jgi:flagellar hook-associated protein 2
VKLDSSHPDIIDGSVTPGALLGTYELEVRSLARTEKELAYGFPDMDQTPVGFGFLTIELEEGGSPIEVVVEPYTTLDKLAMQINDSNAGVKAMVINTKYEPDPYRLLIISEKSGKEAKFTVDSDTTFLEFKEQVTGRNLDVLFEDVPVTDDDNVLDELISQVSLQVRRAEPGTRVQVNIVHDLDATVEGIKTFVDNYNKIAEYINGQFVQDPQTGSYGSLSGEQSLKMIMRQLQQALQSFPKERQKFNTIAEIGITTDPKGGQLQFDETKVRAALTEDYDSVAKLFIRSEGSTGVAERLAESLKTLRDPGAGVLRSRVRGLDQMIKNQDKDIERRERQLQQKEETIRRQFSSLENNLADLSAQGNFLKQRFGGGADAPGGG